MKVAKLNRSSLNVLELIMRMADRGETITLRKIMDGMGWTGFKWLQFCLLDLRNAGLITWDSGKTATIRPACRFIPAENIDLKGDA